MRPVQVNRTHPSVRTAKHLGIGLTRYLLLVSVSRQVMWLFERRHGTQYVLGRVMFEPLYVFRKEFRISTSRFGIGQEAGSNKTPLGLHRIAQKVGAGYPIGTVFRGRRAIGSTWQGLSEAPIAHRICWLEGLEPGRNKGGNVDSHGRYIYIHGVGDELTLGRPTSSGCIHMAAEDLMPLFDRLPEGTLVWIGL